jgi:hypothetical protein
MAPNRKSETPLAPLTARVSAEAARRLRVAAALENLSTGQLLDRLLLTHLPPLTEMMAGQSQQAPKAPEE